MWFETIIREETGCAAYMVGCQRTNECMVFDPLWDVQPYLDMAREKKSTIRYIIDSHSHADHVSGARRLAEATGGELMLPELADSAYSCAPSGLATRYSTLSRPATTPPLSAGSSTPLVSVSTMDRPPPTASRS